VQTINRGIFPKIAATSRATISRAKNEAALGAVLFRNTCCKTTHQENTKGEVKLAWGPISLAFNV
jgi:hypothetical protein